jgi:hypothetical protein
MGRPTAASAKVRVCVLINERSRSSFSSLCCCCYTDIFFQAKFRIVTFAYEKKEKNDMSDNKHNVDDNDDNPYTYATSQDDFKLAGQYCWHRMYADEYGVMTRRSTCDDLVRRRRLVNARAI